MLSTQRPYLVFFRCGPSSLPARLVAEDPARNWDCAINYWASPEPPDAAAEIYCKGGDNKFEGFLEFWRNDPRSRGYRYYFLLDDDLYFEPGDISRFLELCERHRTELCQPALKWTTFYNMNVTVENPVCELRRVSFVEVMAACMSPATLERLLPTFDMSLSTWGIDWAWACLMKDSGNLHVVDAITIDHTKPVDTRGGALYRMLKSRGVSFESELEAARRRYGEFGGRRTLRGGHIYKKGIPPALGYVLVPLIEVLKTLMRFRKLLVRRAERARRLATP